MRFANRKRIVVGTLFILKQIKHRALSRAKLAFPWRLLFDLLLCALLILSLAEIHLRKHGEQVAVILDNSLSMSAILNDGSGKTRFDLAKEQIATLARVATDRFSLWLTNNQNLADGLTSENIQRALGKLQPSQERDDLNLTLQQVLENKEIKRVIIFSDRLITNEYSLFETSNPIIELRQLPNAPIANIALQSARFIEEKTLEIKAIGFLRSPIYAKISAQTEDGQEIANKEVYLNDGQLTSINLPIDKQLVFKNLAVNIAPLKSHPAELINAITLDDSLLVTRDSNPNNEQIFFVSSQTTTSLGLDKFNFLITSKDRLGDNLKNSKPSLAIFYKNAPTDSYRGRALLILPTDTRYFKKISEAENAKVTYIAETTRPLFYLKPTDFKFQKLAQYQLNVFGEALLRTNKAPALSLLKTENAEFLLYGFDLFPFNGRQDPISSILFLNGLNWLREAAEFATPLTQKYFLEEESDTLNPKPISLQFTQHDQTKAKEEIPSSLIHKLTFLFLGLIFLDLLWLLFNNFHHKVR